MEGYIATGKVIKYVAGWNLLSSTFFAIVELDDDRIKVSIDARQLKYVKKEYPPGSLIPIGFTGNKWIIGSKPAKDDVYLPEDGIPIYEVLDALGPKDKP